MGCVQKSTKSANAEKYAMLSKGQVNIMMNLEKMLQQAIEEFEKYFDTNIGGWNLPNTITMTDAPDGLISSLLPPSKEIKNKIKSFLLSQMEAAYEEGQKNPPIGVDVEPSTHQEQRNGQYTKTRK